MNKLEQTHLSFRLPYEMKTIKSIHYRPTGRNKCSVSSGSVNSLWRSWIEQGLSHSTQFRSFRRRCFTGLWTNQQCQSTEGGWL